MSTAKTDKPVTTQTEKSNPFGPLKPEDKKVTQHDWDYLASAIHHIRVSTLGMSFFGAMLQSIMIDFSFRVPTACISYQPQKKQFLIEINPAFFRLLTMEERMGLLLHEVYHMTHGHLTRIPALQDRMKANKAADAAINQIIPGIPTRMPIRGIFCEDFGLAKNLTIEDYYDQWPDDPEQDPEDGEGDGQGEGQGQPGAGQGNPGRGRVLDEHDWDPNIDESDVMDGVEEVIKRTMVKTSKSYTNLPKDLQDLLESIEKRRKVIDWKRTLKMFLKRTTSGIDKEFTRMRPSKRYDYSSPGLRLGELPKLSIFLDTSGSMSTIEINAGLDQVDEVLKVGARKVNMGLWHTDLYKTMKYKRGSRDMVHKSVHSGGTDFEPVAQFINKTKPDAVIVFTDGYYSDTHTQVQCPILFVISHGGVEKLVTSYPQQKIIRLPAMGEE